MRVVGKNSLKISVITCAHNPRPDYLGKVVDALKKQTLDNHLWEYLLVDNASEHQLESSVDLSWHPLSRHLREEELGLTYARLRGIRESCGELLIFVDDDNVLDSDFLEQAQKIADGWQHLGSWSGQTSPAFEEAPPEWTKRYWGNLVIRQLESDAWSNLPHFPATMPSGAGLCVRRGVADRYLHLHESGQRDFVLDRKGDSLISAGDNDLAACACDLGLGVGVFERLSLTHLIPASRLEETYLLRLIEGIAYSAVIFRSFRSSDLSSYRMSLRRRVANLLRSSLMNRRERKFFRATYRGEARALAFLKNINNKNMKQRGNLLERASI